MWKKGPGRETLDLQSAAKTDKFDLFCLIPRHDLRTCNGGKSPKTIYEGFYLSAQRASFKCGDIVDALSDICAFVNSAWDGYGALGRKTEGNKELCPRDLSRTWFVRFWGPRRELVQAIKTAL